MHMSDALLAPSVAGAMYIASSGVAAYSVKKLKTGENEINTAVMGVMGAFVFSAQMINFTIPGTGASGHLCGGMLLTALLGPYAAFVSMVGILLIQCLLFADGGIMALGANVFNMAFYGCFVGGGIILRLAVKNGANKKKIMLGSVFGGIISLESGALTVTLLTLTSGITELPFGVFAGAMLPIHLIIGLVEGLITGVVLSFVQEVRPELVWCIQDEEKGKGRLSLKKTVAVLGLCATVMGGLFSLIASENPDGLEWSIKNITGDTELESEGAVYDKSEGIQNKTSIMAGYSVKNTDANTGTSISGLVGGAAVILVTFFSCYAIKIIRKKKKYE